MLDRHGSLLDILPLIALIFVAITHATLAAAIESPARRNILFIAVDDMRTWANYTGEYPASVRTPNIDALAAVSTRYLNAYATVPQCVGSRASVMMGLSPATHHIIFPSWGVEPEVRDLYANPGLLSLPQVLAQNGYYTAVTGKVFSDPMPERWLESGPSPEPKICVFCPGPDGTFFTVEVQPGSEVHIDQTIANWASNFITHYDRDEPFFLAVGFNLPHLPWRAPQWAYDLYPLEDVVAPVPIAGDLKDEPALAVQLVKNVNSSLPNEYEMVERAGKAAEYTRAYLAAISHTDAMIGQILAALAASDYAANTDIILWSDHGFHLGEKFHWGKNTLWDPAIKVPLLVSAPGNANYPVGNVAAPVSLLDLAPTVVDLAGLAAFPQFEGEPLRVGRASRPVEIYFNKGRATVISGDKKIIDYDLETDSGTSDQAAYSLTDRDEKDNLLRAQAPKIQPGN